MELSINGEVLQFNYESWWGPMYIYETIMDIENHPERKFNPVKTVCLHTMLYSILLNDNPEMQLTFEDFLKAIEDFKLYQQILQFYNKRVAILMDLQPGSGDQAGDEPDESKKKRSPRTRSTSV